MDGGVRHFMHETRTSESGSSIAPVLHWAIEL